MPVFFTLKHVQMAVRRAFDPALLHEMITNTGESLYALSEQQPVLLVFLRHFGCTFCREALADIAARRAEIEAAGTKVVFVHMTAADVAERYFSRYQLEGAVHIGDPECKYYTAFGLTKGNLTQLFGLQSWIRGFSAGVVSGHGIGPQLGDGFQMPGLFVIQDGEVKSSFIHKLASDRPDYIELARCCTIEE
jgi:peroxiredoxin